MDVHVRQTITDQPRRRGVDVHTAVEDGRGIAAGEAILDRAHELGRVLFTQDIRFRALAIEWQKLARPFSGLVFGHQMGGTIGQFVRDRHLIVEASAEGDWSGAVEYLPF